MSGTMASARLLRLRSVVVVAILAAIASSRAHGQTLDRPVVSAPATTGSVIQVPSNNPLEVWQNVIDALDDHYPIERNSPPIYVQGAWEPGRLQSFALVLAPNSSITAPEQRRWVGVSLIPNGLGCRIEVSSFVETREILHGVDPEAARWRPVGRDTAEEQRIVMHLATTVGNGAQVFDALPPPEAVVEPHSRYWRLERAKNNVIGDAANFYSVPSLATLGVAFGIGAAIANTDADKEIRSAWQHGIGYSSGIHSFKYFGEGLYTLPAYVAIGLTGIAFENRRFGNVFEEFGARGLRTALVGGLPMLLMQEVTGGGRPGEHPWGSRWVPFYDNNGVSGHSFIGAIPFLTAAKMTDRPVLKVAFYGLSVMPALSRINDDAHYPSQAFLGYTMAVVAAVAVDNTQHGRVRSFIVPFCTANATGIGFEFKR
jgi:hypothetical protein